MIRSGVVTPRSTSCRAIAARPSTTTPRRAALLWPGWDTQGVAAGSNSRTDLDVRYAGPDGVRISMFLMAGLGGVQSRLADGGYELKPSGSTILQDYPAHTHVNWFFSKAGRYTLTVTARSSKADGTSATTVPHTYTIDVGHVDRAGAQAPAKGTAASGAQAGSSPVAGAGAALAAAGSARAGAAGSSGSGTQGAVPDGTAAASADRPAAGSASDGAGQCTPTKVTREATKEEAAALTAKDGTGTKGGKGAQAGKDAQAASGSSAPASSATRATTTLTLNVGPGATGNATEGHFDLGPAIIDGALVARVKDDRHQPAAWVDPASLTFALGDAAALKAPKDVSFVAKEGSTVRMIRSTQVRGVPWLGMNSQREEIVNGTTGEVTFRLDSVDGPDKVVVFAAGGLGTGVGQHVFDGAGSSYTLPANTHAHQNWLVTQPGTYHLTITMSVTPKDGALAAGTGDGKAGSDSVPEAGTVAARAPGGLRATGEKGPNGLSMVEETVGRTPDGRPCDLGDLARTGTDPVAPLAASALLGLLGAGVLTGRRRALSHRGQ
ncbi:TIGR03773 family transporter-associated surface protein [Actinomyces haliotis]|uniref:TIGR03773 family transporter-associated surface protein n=1 Tax=Actinomyces haliotis TaxID=1280843 RepID=UPI002B26ABBD|nr:TIGR03773 family transporter-associated surface protein [Actinomyces haliotis]